MRVQVSKMDPSKGAAVLKGRVSAKPLLFVNFRVHSILEVNSMELANPVNCMEFCQWCSGKLAVKPGVVVV